MAQQTAQGSNDCDTGACPPQVENAMDWSTFAPPSAERFSAAQTPSVVIEFCNRCRWLHRATWVQTELFLTFEDKPDDGGDEAAAGKGKYATATGLKSIQLIPCNAPETGGRFRVWLYRQPVAVASASTTESDHKDDASSAKQPASALGSFQDGSVVLCWDRKIQGGFPELKVLKQIIRDQIAPSHSLGHSDRHK